MGEILKDHPELQTPRFEMAFLETRGAKLEKD